MALTGAQAIAAEPQTAPASTASGGALVSTTVPDSRGRYLQDLWSISNQFGTGHAWVEHVSPAVSVTHLSFTDIQGESIEETVTAGRIEVLSSAGSLRIRKLANGDRLVRVWVRPGLCPSEPENTVAATGGSASLQVDSQGLAADSARAAVFSSTLRAFSCETAAVGSNLRSAVALAGMPVPTMPPALVGGALPSGGILHTDSCGTAMAAVALAAAGLAGALSAAGGTAGMASPLVLLAWAGYVMAVDDAAHQC